MENYRFEYKDLETISDDCKRQGLSIAFARNIDILYESVEIGGRKVGNRLATLPMEGSDGTSGGKPGDLTFRRWKRFGAGGAKLIWGEAAAVVMDGRSNPRQLVMARDNVRELSELVKETRRSHRERYGTDKDLLIGIQLTHAGRHCFTKPVIAHHSPACDQFSFIDKRAGIALPEDYPTVTDGYLETLEDRFVEAAEVARNAGFDFVDLKQCHSYLLNELLSARERPGNYGGSFKNRRRFIRNVLKKVTATIGDEIIIASRLNVYDGVPYEKDAQTGIGKTRSYPIPYVWGWGVNHSNPEKEDLTEPKKLVDMLSSLGVDLFGITIGSPYWSPHLVRPFNRPVEGGYLPPEHPLEGVARMFRLTGEMQRAFPSVPMVGAGYSWLRHFLLNAGATNVASGNVAIVGVGRSAFAYPDFAVDGCEKGTMDSTKTCLADSMCSNMLKAWAENGEKVPAGCPVRDAEYRELYRVHGVARK